MKRMLMAATTAAMIEQFNKDNILILEEMGYEVHILGNFYNGNPISEEQLENFKIWIEEHHGKWFHYPATRKPVDLRNNIKAYEYLLKLIKKYQYEFIHCHTPIGSVIARLAAHKTRTKVIYTAHGFHFFKGAPLRNWFLYYPIEKLLSYWTDVLILINQEDYQRAKRKFHAKRTVYIHGVGVNIKKFITCNIDKKRKCRELGIESNNFILLSVGELSSRKNQKIVIEALGKLRNPNIYYLIVGKGPLEGSYKKMIRSNNMEKQIQLLGFRTDINELCQIADCFIHPSIREGLGIAPLEAMASGLPLISANINGMKDYTNDGISGCCVNPKSVQDICNAINRIYSDVPFRKQCGKNNMQTAQEYSCDKTNYVMRELYELLNTNIK